MQNNASDNDGDDWNLEDVTERKVEEFSDKESDGDSSQPDLFEGIQKRPPQPKPEEEEAKESDALIKSQMVANWIIENEIAKCIEAALSLRSLRQQELLN